MNQITKTKTQQRPISNIDPHVLFTAETQCEPYTDVHVLTTRADYADALFDELLRRADRGIIPYPRTHEECVSSMFAIHNERIVSTYERVIIDKGNITVILNVNEIDEQATYKAFRYVAGALEKSNGNDCVITFSARFTYEASELFWLFTH